MFGVSLKNVSPYDPERLNISEGRTVPTEDCRLHSSRDRFRLDQPIAVHLNEMPPEPLLGERSTPGFSLIWTRS